MVDPPHHQTTSQVPAGFLPLSWQTRPYRILKWKKVLNRSIAWVKLVCQVQSQMIPKYFPPFYENYIPSLSGSSSSLYLSLTLELIVLDRAATTTFEEVGGVRLGHEHLPCCAWGSDHMFEVTRGRQSQMWNNEKCRTGATFGVRWFRVVPYCSVFHHTGN